MKTLLIILAAVLVTTIFTSSTFAHNVFFGRNLRAFTNISQDFCSRKYSNRSNSRSDIQRRNTNYSQCPRIDTQNIAY